MIFLFGSIAGEFAVSKIDTKNPSKWEASFFYWGVTILH
jgi:hypothetical protein